MAGNINLTEQLKKYFGFDTFKGNQEAIIRNLLEGKGYLCVDADRRRKVIMLSASFALDGRNGNCYFPFDSPYEKSG